MGNDLRREAVRGVLWSAIERFSVQIVQFMIHIILARLLLPSDFGLIGMLAIFLQISQLLIDGGFSNALIQKQDRTEIDFSTVFYFNMFISIALYCVLFWTAPFIANFYHIPELSSVVRVILFFCDSESQANDSDRFQEPIENFIGVDSRFRSRRCPFGIQRFWRVGFGYAIFAE